MQELPVSDCFLGVFSAGWFIHLFLIRVKAVQLFPRIGMVAEERSGDG